MLVTVAPGTPEDSFAPVFEDAWGGREDVAETGGEDDLAGAEGGLLVGVTGEGDVEREEGVEAVAGGDGGDGAVDHRDGGVVVELLASSMAEVGRGDAVDAKDVMHVPGWSVAIYS